jgi:hypothetical protein
LRSKSGINIFEIVVLNMIIFRSYSQGLVVAQDSPSPLMRQRGLY